MMVQAMDIKVSVMVVDMDKHNHSMAIVETSLLTNLKTQKGLISAPHQMNALVIDIVLKLDFVQVQKTLIMAETSSAMTQRNHLIFL